MMFDIDVIMPFLADEDDDDEVQDADNCDQVKITINIEDWKRLGDPQFRRNFRMERPYFESLLLALGGHLVATGRLRRKSKEGLDISLMMVLWILATPDTFRSVAVKFGVMRGTVHFHYKYIIEALREMAQYYVRWPSLYERELISNTFERAYGYPGVCGCIDGCLIQITAPNEQSQEYVDRHHNYSILLQGVCDHNLLFRDVYVGEPGSVGDKRTFQRSPIGQNILFNDNIVGDKHLLGDGGYTLTSKLVIPYRNNGNLTPVQRRHNFILSRCRSSIERAFALLKGKWRRLKCFPNRCLDYALDHIMACIVLHNFLILEGVKYEGQCDVDLAPAPNVAQARRLLNEAKAGGLVRRDHIANLL